jgi:hypothetical protein
MKLPDGSRTAGKVYAKCIMDFENRIKADFRNKTTRITRPGSAFHHTEGLLFLNLIRNQIHGTTTARLTLVSEPEAAALFCAKSGLLNLKVGDAILIVDCVKIASPTFRFSRPLLAQNKAAASGSETRVRRLSFSNYDKPSALSCKRLWERCLHVRNAISDTT